MINCLECKHLARVYDGSIPDLSSLVYYCNNNLLAKRLAWEHELQKQMPLACSMFEAKDKLDTRIYRAGEGNHRIIEDMLGKELVSKA